MALPSRSTRERKFFNCSRFDSFGLKLEGHCKRMAAASNSSAHSLVPRALHWRGPFERAHLIFLAVTKLRFQSSICRTFCIVRDQLPCFNGKLKLWRCHISPPFECLCIRRFIKRVLNFYAFELREVIGHATSEAAAPDFNFRQLSSCHINIDGTFECTFRQKSELRLNDSLRMETIWLRPLPSIAQCSAASSARMFASNDRFVPAFRFETSHP